eukprot:3758589-Amphidinium_carterae.1
MAEVKKKPAKEIAEVDPLKKLDDASALKPVEYKELWTALRAKLRDAAYEKCKHAGKAALTAIRRRNVKRARDFWGVSITARVIESERWVQIAIDEPADKHMRILLPHPKDKGASSDDGFYLTRGLHARALRFRGHPLFKDLQNGSTN